MSLQYSDHHRGNDSVSPKNTVAPPKIGSPAETDSDAILRHLTTQQHLHPHQGTGDVLAQTVDRFGCCPVAIETALAWLKLDGHLPIGRLRRTELVQLSKAVHRFWSKSASTPSI